MTCVGLNAQKRHKRLQITETSGTTNKLDISLDGVTMDLETKPQNSIVIITQERYSRQSYLFLLAVGILQRLSLNEMAMVQRASSPECGCTENSAKDDVTTHVTADGNWLISICTDA